MVQIDTIYNMDCLVGMKEIESDSIDFCLSDPPYNIGKQYDVYKDKKSDKEHWKWIEDVYSEIYRVLKPNSHLTFTCAQLQIWPYKAILQRLGFTFRHIGIWSNPGRKAGSYPGQWPYSWEAIMDFTKGNFRKLNNGNSVGFMDVWIEKPPVDTKHPTRRPIGCWMDLIKLMSDESEVVLDPFNGSGTTSLACKQLNRRYIAYEISEAYCDEARKRTANGIAV